jgi:acetyl-CoA C-acetyltransferase
VSSQALIIDGVRSPRGRGKPSGSLHGIHPQELLAQVLVALTDRVGIEPSDIDDVIVGNGSFDDEHGSDIARLAILTSGWPLSIPGVTLNRFCGSGQQAVSFGAMAIMSGQQDVVIGGGVESMSRWVTPQRVSTIDGNNQNLRKRYPIVPQGVSADLIATVEGFSRGDVDAFALRSQQRCAEAASEARFARSLVPIHHLDGSLALDHDEYPRPETTLEALAALRPSFEELGTVPHAGYDTSFDEMCQVLYPETGRIRHIHHAGNSSGVVDGAAAMLLTSQRYASAHGLMARGRVVETAVTGSEPVIMLTAPGPAAELCLRRAGMTVRDIDLWEINEAFAAIPLKMMRDHDIPLDTALDELERRDATTALVAMCTGGGMGTATIIERT